MVQIHSNGSKTSSCPSLSVRPGGPSIAPFQAIHISPNSPAVATARAAKNTLQEQGIIATEPIRLQGETEQNSSTKKAFQGVP